MIAAQRLLPSARRGPAAIPRAAANAPIVGPSLLGRLLSAGAVSRFVIELPPTTR